MAEATVESPRSRFFCHVCRSEVQPNIPAFTCSQCDGGFIEEIERPPPSVPNPEGRLAEVFSAALLGRPAPSGRSYLARHGYNTRSAARVNDDSDMDLSEDEELRGVGPSAVFRISEQPGPQTFHGIINYVIQRLNDREGVLSPLILHGNPGDYAWGAGGLDAIISQLLNHLEGTGAPPAQKEKIDKLPTIRIEQTHIDNTLQCSICMDDFELEMEVRKLPCEHLYHSECIVKWLEMHGTCPVCRKDLNGEDTSTNDADFTIFPPPNEGDGGQTGAGSSSSSSTSMGPSTSSSFIN